ncbi:MAG: 16S rRNA (adenine(1518)-N(6)/adenine(1519)-N(6))-dimethyltransferase RsmA [Candidatus Omnitrophota bacterium]
MLPKPKKSLGQNFLTDGNIQRKIIDSLDLRDKDIVLEIGSGGGCLTKLIAKKVLLVYAVELDSRLCALMEDDFKQIKNIKIIHADFLKLRLETFLKTGKVKVVGNIPYYISSPIIQRLLEFKRKIDSAYLTVQKEFALRIVSPPGPKTYGSLSVFAQYHTQPEILFYISRNCFNPSPRVDSAFIRLIPKHKQILNKQEELLFFKIVRGAFMKRRKTLKNSLQGIIPQAALGSYFSQRPETLSIRDFVILTKKAKKRSFLDFVARKASD